MTLDKTWTRGVIVVIIIVAISYGLWFDYLDSLPGIGKSMGGNMIYQSWNIIGHFIPGLLLLFLFPNKFEVFLAAFLISTMSMDLPWWGAERLYLHSGFLWDKTGNTYSLIKWITFYYLPWGNYPVWQPALFPTATMIFLSIVLRLGAAIGLIYYQNKLEVELSRRVTLKEMVRR